MTPSDPGPRHGDGGADEPGPLSDGLDLQVLARWLSEGLGHPVDPETLDVRSPSSGGWSNDTWLVALGSEPRAVVRLEPERAAMFPDYDLGRQVRCLELIARKTDVPVPALLGVDLGGERFGRPAFVMELVLGRVPSDDRPTFAEAGWLVEAAPHDQRRFHIGLIEAIAQLHVLTADDPDVAALRSRRQAADSNRALVADLRAIWDFDRGNRSPVAVDRAFGTIEASAPKPTADVLLWGDARPANVVVASDGFAPVALLDWELATVSSPEHDVAWLAEMNWLRTEGAGLTAPPGFLTDEAAEVHYERVGGRELSRHRWYRRFAALRVAVLMHRYLRTMVHAGRLPADHHLLEDTVASRRLEALIEA